MLDIRAVRERTEEISSQLKRRGADYGIDELAALEAERVENVQLAEDAKRERNELSRQMGQRMKKGENADDIQEASRALGDKIKELDARLKEIQELLRQKLLMVPNIPDKSVPDGKGDEENLEVFKWGQPPSFGFEPKSHAQLGEDLGILDLKRAAKLSGARFALYTGAGAALERALINFMLDTHVKENGYSETAPPYMVSGQTMTGTGQLPKFAEDGFKVEGADLWLIPTAEVPLTNIYSGEILKEEDLPISMTAYTPSFRAEAGSYGKDTAGIIRLHQFAKVELVKLAAEEQAMAELEKLTQDAEGIMQKLGLAYRKVVLCAGDMGFSAAKTYDLEVWVPSQNKYREISSCSWCSDFQSRRMNLRYQQAAPEDKGKGRNRLVHTLNGSGLAVGRTWVAIMENFQDKDGSVAIPPPLQPYMGGMEKILKP